MSNSPDSRSPDMNRMIGAAPMSDALPPEVLRQIAALAIEPERPLIICDADEVLLHFLEAFEAFLEEQDLVLNLTSYALTGNILTRAGRTAIEPAAVGRLIKDFFHQRTEQIPAVNGAAEALRALAKRCRIVIVTNVPPAHRTARIAGLRGHDMDYPVIINQGVKGAVVKALAHNMRAPVLFLDDAPPHLISVAAAAPHVHRIHFIANARLAAVLEPLAESHYRAREWPQTHRYIQNHLDDCGY
jgi:hypothetical protein